MCARAVEKSNAHLLSDSAMRRHAALRLYGRNIIDFPRVTRASHRGLLLGTVEPVGLVFPAGRKLNSEAGFLYRNVFLKAPHIFLQVRAALLLILVADHAARLGLRDDDAAQAIIAIELAIERRHLNGFFVFHFVIRALWRYAPGFEVSDLRL